MISFTELRTLNSELWAKERDRLSLWIPVLLATGIGVYYALPTEPPLWALPWIVGALAIIGWLVRQVVWARLVVTSGLILALGFSAAAWRTYYVAAPVLHKTLYFRQVEGRIDDIRIKTEGKTLVLSEVRIEGVQERTTPARVSVSLRKKATGFEIGDSIKIKAMLFPPPTPTMPGAYDFARAFYYDRLGAVGYSPFAPEVTAKAAPHSFELWLNKLRLSTAERIKASMTPENAPVATAMMVGEDSEVTDEVKDAMRDAGIYHVLSISGLHMSLAVGLVYFAVRFLLSLYMPLALRWPIKKISAVVGLLSALAYLLLAGYPVPAIRSFVMVACVMVAVLFDRRGISLYSLAWAASLILLFQPESLLGASFELSFAATMAILALYERYSHLLYKPGMGGLRKVGTYFSGLVVTSLAATLATTPLVIYHFNRFTVWGILANVLMVPLASFWIMPAAVIVFLSMPFGLEAGPLLVLDRGIGLMVEGSRWFASLPYASFALPSPTFAGFLMMVYGGLWLCLWQRRWRLLGIPAIVIGLATLALHKPYDLLISDDASKVMVRLGDGEPLFIKGRVSSFDAEAWLKSEGRETALTLQDVQDKPGAPDCDKERCLITLRGKTIVVALRKEAVVCDAGADIVIAPERLDRPCAPLLLDGRFLEDNGATGLRFINNVIQIDTAMQHRGHRPWVSLPYSLYLKEKKGSIADD